MKINVSTSIGYIHKPKDSLNSASEFDKIVTLKENPLEPAANVIISSTC